MSLENAINNKSHKKIEGFKLSHDSLESYLSFVTRDLHQVVPLGTRLWLDYGDPRSFFKDYERGILYTRYYNSGGSRYDSDEDGIMEAAYDLIEIRDDDLIWPRIVDIISISSYELQSR